MRRDIGLIGLSFIAISAIFGSGWLFVPLLASQHAGPAAMIAWVIGGVAMLLLALTFAEIAAMLPVPGGIARVPQFSHGNITSMAVGWSAWVGYNTTAPIEVEAMLRYLAPHLRWLYDSPDGDTLSWAGIALASTLLVVFVIINALGVKFFSYVNATITWAKIAIPIIVIVALFASRFETENLTAAGGFSPFGLHGVLAAVSSGGIIFSYIGFRHAIDMAGEVKRPGFTIPAALIASVFVCFLLYGSMQLAFIGALPEHALANGWAHVALPGELGPLGAIAAALGLLWLVSLLNVGAVVGPFGGGLVASGSNARLAYALGQNGFFPAMVATLSKRGVPLTALIVNLVFSALAFVLLPFQEIVKLNSSAIVLSFVVGPIAVVALRMLMPDRERPFRLPAVHVLGATTFVIATLVLYWSGWDTLWRLGICLLAGLVLFLINSRRRGDMKFDLKEAAWLIPYLAGTGLISFLGTFGGGREVIPFGWDVAVIAIFSVLVFLYAVRCRLSKEKLESYLRDEHVLDERGRGGSPA